MQRRGVKRVLVAILAAGPFLLLVPACPTVPAPLLQALQLGRPTTRIEAPAFDLPTLGSRPIRLSDLRGRVVLLYFWATW